MSDSTAATAEVAGIDPGAAAQRRALAAQMSTLGGCSYGNWQQHCTISPTPRLSRDGTSVPSRQRFSTRSDIIEYSRGHTQLHTNRELRYKTRIWDSFRAQSVALAYPKDRILASILSALLHSEVFSSIVTMEHLFTPRECHRSFAEVWPLAVIQNN